MSKIHQALAISEPQNAAADHADPDRIAPGLSPQAFPEGFANPDVLGTEPITSQSDPSLRLIEEVVRTLRANLLVRMQQQQRVLIVASARPGEGKSTIVALLARSMAALRRVLVIDADLRRPRVSALLGCVPGKGVTEVAAGESPEAYIQTVNGISVLPPGACDADPQRRLGSRSFSEAMQFFRGRFDLILIDTPPVLACADAVVLAPLSDGALMVAKTGEVMISEMVEARRRLEAGGAKVLGGIINGVNGTAGSPTAPYANYVKEASPAHVDEAIPLSPYAKAAGAKG
jgi:capsular exopolysaccharide synthesis family protein